MYRGPTVEFEIGQLEPSLLDSDFVTRLSDFGMKLKVIFRKRVEKVATTETKWPMLSQNGR